MYTILRTDVSGEVGFEANNFKKALRILLLKVNLKYKADATWELRRGDIVVLTGYIQQPQPRVESNVDAMNELEWNTLRFHHSRLWDGVDRTPVPRLCVGPLTLLNLRWNQYDVDFLYYSMTLVKESTGWVGSIHDGICAPKPLFKSEPQPSKEECARVLVEPLKKILNEDEHKELFTWAATSA